MTLKDFILKFKVELAKNTHPKVLKLLKEALGSESPPELEDIYITLLQNRSKHAIKFALELKAAHPRLPSPWKELSKNPMAIDILLADESKIEWHQFCSNPAPQAVVKLLELPNDRLSLGYLLLNENRDVLPLLQREELLHKILGNNLAENIEEDIAENIEEDIEEDTEFWNDPEINHGRNYMEIALKSSPAAFEIMEVKQFVLKTVFNDIGFQLILENPNVVEAKNMIDKFNELCTTTFVSNPDILKDHFENDPYLHFLHLMNIEEFNRYKRWIITSNDTELPPSLNQTVVETVQSLISIQDFISDPLFNLYPDEIIYAVESFTYKPYANTYTNPDSSLDWLCRHPSAYSLLKKLEVDQRHLLLCLAHTHSEDAISKLYRNIEKSHVPQELIWKMLAPTLASNPFVWPVLSWQRRRDFANVVNAAQKRDALSHPVVPPDRTGVTAKKLNSVLSVLHDPHLTRKIGSYLGGKKKTTRRWWRRQRDGTLRKKK